MNQLMWGDGFQSMQAAAQHSTNRTINSLRSDTSGRLTSFDILSVFATMTSRGTVAEAEEAEDKASAAFGKCVAGLHKAMSCAPLCATGTKLHQRPTWKANKKWYKAQGDAMIRVWSQFLGV